MVNKKINKQLTNEQFEVTQNCGTEPPFSGKYYQHSDNGIYFCICCDSKLFDSKDKYDSGSGWPSFSDQIDSSCIKKIIDKSHGLNRVEIRCANCDAHLGHVFMDGPTDTGKRYCVNSLSLDFKGNSQ